MKTEAKKEQVRYISYNKNIERDKNLVDLSDTIYDRYEYYHQLARELDFEIERLNNRLYALQKEPVYKSDAEQVKFGHFIIN